MSELNDWEDSPEAGVRVALRLGEDYEEAGCTLPGVPRVGDKVTLHGNHPETGNMRVRYYRVREVEWAISEPDAVPGADWPPTIYVYCDALGVAGLGSSDSKPTA